MKRLPNLQFIRSLDRKFVLNVSIRIGTVLLFLFLILIPSCTRLGAFKDELSSEKVQLLNARSKIATALRIQENRSQFLEEIKSVEGRFFSEDELSQLLNIVSELAKTYDLQMTASKPVQEAEKIIPQAIPAPKTDPVSVLQTGTGAKAISRAIYTDQKFEVELSGSYHSLGRFLSVLKKQPKMISVKKLALVSSPVSDTEHEIKLTLAVYSKLR